MVIKKLSLSLFFGISLLSFLDNSQALVMLCLSGKLSLSWQTILQRSIEQEIIPNWLGRS